MQRIGIIGPAHPLRGGLASFNQRLAFQFIKEGNECELISFSLQYPSLFFPGKSQFTTEPAPEGIKIHSVINSVNPANWVRIGRWLCRKRFDVLVVRYWIPLMGPAFGTILRHVKRNRHTKIICIADNVIPHEHRPGDRSFTRYFIRSCDAFITMSDKVMADLRKFDQHKPAILVQHPLYDAFGDKISKEQARHFLGLKQEEKIILFFGFIRKYKGLDLLLKAMAAPSIRQQGIKLLVAGEFYEEEKPYRQLIDELGIRDLIYLKTHFIPDGEVKYYLCAADVVLQPYRNATQSGVTPLAYHFEKPMIVTNVGGLPSLVPHQKVGLVTEPEPIEIAKSILHFYQLGETFFIPHICAEKQKYSWHNLTNAIRQLAEIK